MGIGCYHASVSPSARSAVSATQDSPHWWRGHGHSSWHKRRDVRRAAGLDRSRRAECVADDRQRSATFLRTIVVRARRTIRLALRSGRQRGQGMNPRFSGSPAMRKRAKAFHGGAGLPSPFVRLFLLSRHVQFILQACSLTRCAARGCHPAGQHDRELSRPTRSSPPTGIIS